MSGATHWKVYSRRHGANDGREDRFGVDDDQEVRAAVGEVVSSAGKIVEGELVQSGHGHAEQVWCTGERRLCNTLEYVLRSPFNQKIKEWQLHNADDCSRGDKPRAPRVEFLFQNNIYSNVAIISG